MCRSAYNKLHCTSIVCVRFNVSHIIPDAVGKIPEVVGKIALAVEEESQSLNAPLTRPLVASILSASVSDRQNSGSGSGSGGGME